MKKRYRMTEADIENVRRMIEVEHLQQRIVAEKIGVHQGTIENLCKRLGLATQRTGPRGGEGHTNWQGGVKMSKGYRYIWCQSHPSLKANHHYVSEHRLVMETKLRRYLVPTEVVHHIDGNPSNNDPKNLMVFQTNGAHLKHELKGKVPNWTPEGLVAIRTSYQRRRSVRPQVSGDDRQPQSNVHQP